MEKASHRKFYFRKKRVFTLNVLYYPSVRLYICLSTMNFSVCLIVFFSVSLFPNFQLNSKLTKGI